MPDLESRLRRLEDAMPSEAPSDLAFAGDPQRGAAVLRMDLSPTLFIVGLGLVGIVLLARTQWNGSGVGTSRFPEGSMVAGTGYLIENQSGGVQLCLGGGRLVQAPTCSVVAITVKGVDFRAVPGAIQQGGRWYATNVTVRGKWSGGSVRVETINAGPLTSSPDPPNPCAANEGDGIGLGTPAEESALAGLDEEVFGHPDRYAGLWRATSTDGLGRIVVDVVGDLTGVQAKLGKLYPYPLCLVRAQFSESDLDIALQALGERTDAWLAAVDYPRNRVTVSVGVLTEEVQSRLQPFSDKIFISELLHEV
jgi:hypothetical protein